jgi:hypothetical protein
MNNTFAATNAQIASDAAKPAKKPLTEEQKDVLRNRLAVARAKRSEMAKAGLLKQPTRSPKPKPQNLANETSPPLLATFTIWSDDDWRAAPFDQAMQRLRDLTADRERGATLVTQRQSEEHIGNIYNCIVCRKRVPDGRWIWKNDRRDPMTNMFTSDVLCSQACHDRFSNNVKFYMDRAKGVS